MFRLALGIFVSLFLTQCDEKKYKDENVIHVGLSSDYPPFESRNDNNEIVGFDVDLANMIGKALNKNVVFIDMPLSSLLNSLNVDKVDMIISSATITEERKKKFDFSVPYFFNRLTLVSRKNMPVVTVEECRNKKVGTQLGSIFVAYLVEHQIKDIVTMDLFPQLIEALKAKHVDAVVMDYTSAVDFANKNKGLVYHFLERAKESNGTAVVFKKDSEWKSQVDGVIAQLKSSGALAKLENKWVGS